MAVPSFISPRITRLITAVPAAAALTLCMGAAPAGAQKVPALLFVDGGFESPVVPANTFTCFGVKNSIGPWRVTGGTVDLVGAG